MESLKVMNCYKIRERKKRNKEQMIKIENKQQDDIYEANVSMIIFNANFLNIPIQKPQTDRLDKKKKKRKRPDIYFKYKDQLSC